MMPFSATPPLVMTATIRPGRQPHLTVSDPAVRWGQYQSAIRFWLARPAVRILVFCENSGYPVPYAPLQAEARHAGKTLEILRAAEPPAGTGKAYGEGELLKTALHQSDHLRQAVAFFKVTGRIQVLNFDRIAHRTRATPTALGRRYQSQPLWADTRFFKMERAFYLRWLIDRHQLATPNTILGQLWGPVLTAHHLPGLWPLPHYAGQAGNGQTYDDRGWRRLARNAVALTGGYRL
ncbi:MAG: hypothetical protein M0Z53_07785 [Thermaerobacter sp.]|nr:hypothetical protein [Thermaerobacter sp.]